MVTKFPGYFGTRKFMTIITEIDQWNSSLASSV